MILFLPIVSIFLLNLLSFVSSLPAGSSVEAGSSTPLYKPGRMIFSKKRRQGKEKEEKDTFDKYPAIVMGQRVSRTKRYLAVLHLYSASENKKFIHRESKTPTGVNLLSALANIPKSFCRNKECPTLLDDRLYMVEETDINGFNKEIESYDITVEAFHEALQYALNLRINSLWERDVNDDTASDFRVIMKNMLSAPNIEVDNTPSASTSIGGSSRKTRRKQRLIQPYPPSQVRASSSSSSAVPYNPLRGPPPETSTQIAPIIEAHYGLLDGEDPETLLNTALDSYDPNNPPW